MIGRVPQLLGVTSMRRNISNEYLAWVSCFSFVTSCFSSCLVTAKDRTRSRSSSGECNSGVRGGGVAISQLMSDAAFQIRRGTASSERVTMFLLVMMTPSPYVSHRT
jgi:hypothetical protein